MAKSLHICALTAVGACSTTFGQPAWFAAGVAGIGGPPPGTAAMTFDSLRGRIVALSGTGADMTALEFTDRWRRLADPEITPTHPAAIAYDANRDRIVHFGGPLDQDELWEYDGADWMQIPRGDEPWPSGRRFFPMAYDASRGVTVLYGGIGRFCNDVRFDTWEWNGESWTQAATTGPGPLTGGAMTFDATTNTVLLFGGIRGCSGGTLQGLWSWDGAEWTQIHDGLTGPAPRRDGELVAAPELGGVVLFGGRQDGGGAIDDGTWLWNGTDWQLLDLAIDPGPRDTNANVFFGMNYDSLREHIVLFGGRDENATLLADTWLLTNPGEPVAVIDEPDSVLTDLPGESVTLEVVASGEPPLFYTWYRDGEIVDDATAYVGLSSGRLTFDLSPERVGKYTCSVSNTFGAEETDTAIAAIRPNPCRADLAPPVDVLDLGDIDAFISSFLAGCP